MKNLFLAGGLFFMGILTLLMIIMIVWIIYYFITGLNSQQINREKTLYRLEYGRSIGLFAMITGIFGQLIGLYYAFSAIEQAGDIAPVLVYGGIKVSMIPTLYGIFIYILSLLLWFVARMIIEKKSEQ